MRQFLLLFALIVSIQAQAVHFSNLSSKDKLAHPAVLAISQDSLGRIWLGTAEGISIYDGNKIVSYKPNSGIGGTPLFKGNQVVKIVCSAQGDVFFKTNAALVKYDIRKGTFQNILDKGGFALYSKQGTVWVAVDYELYQWNEEKQQLISQNKLSAGTIYDFLIDAKGRKWFSISNGVIYTDDGVHFKTAISNNDMRDLFCSSNGDIWAGSKDSGLFRIQSDDKLVVYNTANSSSKGLNDNQIRGITEDKNGNIWFGTFNGLYKYHPRNDLFESYTRNDKAGNLSHSSVHPVFIDKGGILWIGTYFGGVNYSPIYQNTFTFYNASAHPNSLSNPVVGSMVEDNKGNIWICTEGGGLNMLNPSQGEIKRFETTHFPFYLPHINLKSVLYDPESEQLYIGTNGRGLYTYTIKQNKFSEEIGQDKSSNLNTINAMVRSGEYLFLSANKSIYKYSLKTKKQELFCNTNMFANIFLSADQILWVVANEEIYTFDVKTSKKLCTYNLHKQGIYSTATQAFQSSRKEIYITTLGNGILKLNPQTNLFEPFPSVFSPLLSNYCYRISETHAQNLIVTGDKGVAFLNSKGEVQQTFPIGKYFPLDAFTKDCGLLVGQEGEFYIGGTNGLVVTSEKRKEIFPVNNRIYFAELYVHNNQIRPGDPSGILPVELPFTQRIELSHNQNRIEVLFSSYTPISNNQRIYEYRLKGVDKTWYQTTQKTISYTNLSPGRYTLEVRESNHLQGSTSETARLEIVVLPPWYASWWAWLIWISLFLLCSGFAYNILRARRRLRDSIRMEQMEKQQIKEINEAKFKFFTSVSHEFRTPLTLIIGQLEVLLQGNNLAPLIYNKLIKVIHQCQQLNSLVTELIEFRKYEQGRNTLHVSPHPINQYIAEIYDGFRELAIQQNILFSMSPCEEETEVWFDGKQMTKAIYNLLSNAFKYTPKDGAISLNLFVDKPKRLLLISITDSGVGIDGKDIPYIFERFYQADNKMPEQKQQFRTGIGLALVKSIIEEHKGTVDVKSQAGQGSVFTISLRLDKEELQNNPHILFEEKKEMDISLQLQPAILLPEEKTIDSGNGLLVEAEKPVIVLVEDNTELLEILVNIFSPLYTTKTATNGQEGIEIIREVNPDLVVSDVMMPIMTGTELCVKIKNNIELCHIPVILLTALNMPEQHLEGLIRGADDYIYKPFSPQILLARCNNIIRTRRILYKQYAQKAEADLSLLATNSLDKEFLDKITSVIDINVSDPEFNIDKLASEMYMGRTSFYNKFKALTGMSPNDFINSYKLKKAAILLKQDNPLSITEISDTLGFNTPNYFCRKFKEQFEVSPTLFKQKAQEEKRRKETGE